MQEIELHDIVARDEQLAGRIEAGILLQEVDRVPQLVDGKGLPRISVDDAIAFHLEPLRVKVLKVRGMGEVHEDFVVKLPDVVDGFVE